MKSTLDRKSQGPGGVAGDSISRRENPNYGNGRAAHTRIRQQRPNESKPHHPTTKSTVFSTGPTKLIAAQQTSFEELDLDQNTADLPNTATGSADDQVKHEDVMYNVLNRGSR